MKTRKDGDVEGDRREKEILAAVQADLRSKLQFVRLGVGPDKGKLAFDVYPGLRERFADTLDN